MTNLQARKTRYASYSSYTDMWTISDIVTRPIVMLGAAKSGGPMPLVYRVVFDLFINCLTRTSFLPSFTSHFLLDSIKCMD